MFFLTGCTSSEVLFPDTVQNPFCVQEKEIYIVRVMNNYVLGWIRNVNDSVVQQAQNKYQAIDPHFVFIPRQPQGIYMPNQKILLNDSQCLTYIGAYRYQYNETTQGNLLLGRIDPSQIENFE